jgi:hypothetical protein
MEGSCSAARGGSCSAARGGIRVFIELFI